LLRKALPKAVRSKPIRREGWIRGSDEEVILFIRDEQTGRLLFNDRAAQALGLDPIQLQQRGFPVAGLKTSA
jgi:hypothetical protein